MYYNMSNMIDKNKSTLFSVVVQHIFRHGLISMALGGRVIRKILTLIDKRRVEERSWCISTFFLLKLMAYDDYIPRVGPQGKRKQQF